MLQLARLMALDRLDCMVVGHKTMRGIARVLALLLVSCLSGSPKCVIGYHSLVTEEALLGSSHFCEEEEESLQYLRSYKSPNAISNPLIGSPRNPTECKAEAKPSFDWSVTPPSLSRMTYVNFGGF